MRGTFSNQSFQYRLLQEHVSSVNNNLEILIAEGLVPIENIKSVRKQIFVNSFQSTISLFSEGQPLEIVREKYLQSIGLMEQCWVEEVVKFHTGRAPVYKNQYWLDDYCHMVWMLSIGILLKIDGKDFNRICRLNEIMNINDVLIKILSKKIDSNDRRNKEITSYLPFKLLSQNLIKRELFASELREYLKKWYQYSSKLYWYDLHIKRPELFFGYWSFESAALAYMFKLPKNQIGSSPFFPQFDV